MTLRDGNGVGGVLNTEGVSGGATIATVADLSLTNMAVRNNTVTGSCGAFSGDLPVPADYQGDERTRLFSETGFGI